MTVLFLKAKILQESAQVPCLTLCQFIFPHLLKTVDDLCRLGIPSMNRIVQREMEFSHLWQGVQRFVE